MVIPVFNEAATVVGVIMVVLAQRPVRQLVVANDVLDGTRDKLQPQAEGEPRIKLIRHQVDRGKGAALPTVWRGQMRPSSSPGTPV